MWYSQEPVDAEEDADELGGDVDSLQDERDDDDAAARGRWHGEARQRSQCAVRELRGSGRTDRTWREVSMRLDKHSPASEQW